MPLLAVMTYRVTSLERHLVSFMTYIFLLSITLVQNSEAGTSELPNVALKRPTDQGPKTYYPGSRWAVPYMFESHKAVDGLETAYRKECTHTILSQLTWWMVDLLGVFTIHNLAILNRDTYGNRLQNFTVDIFMTDPREEPGFPEISGKICVYHKSAVPTSEWAELNCTLGIHTGRFVRIIKRGFDHLALCEVKVFASIALITKTYQRIPETALHTEPVTSLGTFTNPSRCGLNMFAYNQLNVFQINNYNGNCDAYTKGSNWTTTADGRSDTYVRVYETSIATL